MRREYGEYIEKEEVRRKVTNIDQRNRYDNVSCKRVNELGLLKFEYHLILIIFLPNIHVFN
jgi:hypothetical protein